MEKRYKKILGVTILIVIAIGMVVPQLALTEAPGCSGTDKCNIFQSGCKQTADGCLATDTYDYPICWISCQQQCSQSFVDCKMH